MANFRIIKFEDLFNQINTPAAGLDRYGYPIKSLLVQMTTNKLYILDENNNVIPVSTTSGAIDYDELKKVFLAKGHTVNELTSYINPTQWNKLVSKTCITGIQQGITDILNKYSTNYATFENFIKYVDTTKTSITDINTKLDILSSIISGGITISANVSAELDKIINNFNFTGKTISTFNDFLTYTDNLDITINNVSTVLEQKIDNIAQCTSTNVSSALDLILANRKSTNYSTLNEFLNYCDIISANTSLALASAFQNFTYINSLSSSLNKVSADLYSFIASGTLPPVVTAQIENIASTYIVNNSVTKNTFNELSGKYDTFAAGVLTRDAQISESLSALQTGLDNINENLNDVYQKL